MYSIGTVQYEVRYMTNIILTDKSKFSFPEINIYLNYEYYAVSSKIEPA